MFRYLCHCLFVLVPGMTAGAVAAGDVLLEVPDLKWVLVTQAEGSAVQVLDLSRGVTPWRPFARRGAGGCWRFTCSGRGGAYGYWGTWAGRARCL
jgi:hypothetical protein